ncbi:hypothetical protein Pcinc_018661 [Petrolisthes cinctipes]|uniref:Magnesium-dependent phosphatase 1 n=1 Tax=Petrolisthes cinctipes TaxID=88211 RepID=A0AAE1FMP8_PETCI|nr:hypothetical protein Pcinc_018661 [Petrolisthes cinctipes]
MRKPKLIAFDLDYTLWPFWIDTHVDPPFTKNKDGSVVDSRKKKVKVYPEVPEVLKQLKEEGYQLAAVSRTGETQAAYQLIGLLGWDKYFNYHEIYPGSKITHFKRIQKDSGLDFSEMLFFDDEYRNKVDLDKIGVLMIMVDDGVNKELINKGLRDYASSRQ